MGSQRVLILAERAESGGLLRFFELFEHDRAYEVLAAENRREAVSAIKRGRPDLIVLDPQLKELDGLQLLKQIRVIDPAIPVIIVAGTQKTQEAVEVSQSPKSPSRLSPPTWGRALAAAARRGRNRAPRRRSRRGSRT